MSAELQFAKCGIEGLRKIGFRERSNLILYTRQSGNGVIEVCQSRFKPSGSDLGFDGRHAIRVVARCRREKPDSLAASAID